MANDSEPTIRITIFMAGDIQVAKQVCREYCYEVGLCVTIEPTSYVYTGGEEEGFKVGLINYPRFPSTKADLMKKATELAEKLMHKLYQTSYTIMDDIYTVWYSRREDD